MNLRNVEATLIMNPSRDKLGKYTQNVIILQRKIS